MARHPNQRALTVNTKRVNPNPAPPPQKRAPVMDDLLDGLEDYTGYGPARLSDNYHLMLTGTSRAGGIF